MSIENIKMAMEECKRNTTILPRHKSVKMRVLNTLVEKYNYEQKYKQQVLKYQMLGECLENLTNGQFKLDSNINITEMSLRNYINESEDCKKLQIQNPSEIDYEELYEKTNNEAIKTAIRLYREMEEIVKLEDISADILAYGLIDVCGINNILRKKIKAIVKPNGPGTPDFKEKTDEEYEKGHIMSLEILESYKDILGQEIFELTKEMIGEIFDNYMNGHKEIELVRNGNQR